jgi:hypothetical protein
MDWRCNREPENSQCREVRPTDRTRGGLHSKIMPSTLPIWMGFGSYRSARAALSLRRQSDTQTRNSELAGDTCWLAS